MRKKLLAVAVVGLMASATMTACTDSGDSGDASSGGGTTGGGNGKARVGVILPDTESSNRWRDEDPKYLQAAFDAAKVEVEIQNAQGDRARFQQIADGMINGGVKVLMIANLDSESGRAVLAKAREKKIPTIDYDRLTLNGNANYYVSFNNVQVGEYQGYGLQKCLTAKGARNPLIAQLNGSPSDNNATLFKQGYESVLNQNYDKASYTKGPAQWVPDWDPEEAGKIFEQMLQQTPQISGVLAANDGIADAVIKVLRKYKRSGAVPVTGQDATLEGLQNLLTGEQCMTVYKAVRDEAQNAARVAIQLFKGEDPGVDGVIKDPESGGYVPFISLTPKPITLKNINAVVVDDKYIPEADLCKGKYLPLCQLHKVGKFAEDDDKNADNE
ncbi:sugar ABC transporter substrate-binding protein [Paractinoplanes abujensis]|uniref:D-xylose transport system substrate-binding protein n=1 Tax=Paractinoplanes abujensis TaxID=882441 RepID=A0A7W7FZM9_9ACTN|nr:substrate-binding domain-containing protein [Actinoplanes abujensis]MBB4690712.1 D-xylose transport system substrate-binding protein [Actinoplanes abujensis]GID17875.1 sugar ABC transporter substrate-binding protein [Actinoplanes abujensis]